ncbi:hypothetical protein ACQPXM_17735 [Kribbella sp. CA-253562]|uniref:hypothetical protein n=1 Tax=Kribbella sp. CA-253562 TaxID=3239942 RepID=UPI003D8FD1BA
MRIESFAATADLIGRRVLLRWTMIPVPGASVLDWPVVTIRRKRRDFAFPATVSGAYLVYDDAAFPPAPVPGGTDVVDLPDRDFVAGALRIVERTVTVTEPVRGLVQEVRRRVVRTVFGPDRAVLRREIELLDAGDFGGLLLDAGVPYYYQLDSSSAPHPWRAIATPGEVHGNHRTLYELIPAVYRRHDTVVRPSDPGTGRLPEANAAGGQLRRFVDIFGVSLDAILSSAEGLRGLRATADVDHRFLPLLADWIGWDLTVEGDVARQRSEIATAPKLYGAVGSIPGVRSIVDHYTGWSTRVAELAQNIARSNVAPQRNLFAAVERGGTWWGADDAAPVLGLVPPDAVATGAAGLAAELTGSTTGPFALSPGMSLTVAIDGAVPTTITFGPDDFADVNAATAVEVAAVLGRMVTGADVDAVAGKIRLRSRLADADSRVEVSSTTASLISLDGAPRGRLATVVDGTQRLWTVYAATTGTTSGPRLMTKTCLRGGWLGAVAVEPNAPAPQADPALIEGPNGGVLWLASVEHPDTDRAVLRWRGGLPRTMEPARLHGELRGPFRLTAGTRLTLTGYGTTEAFHIDAAAYPDLSAASADQVAQALKAQLAGVDATPAADGGLSLNTVAAGPGVVLRVDLAASTAARTLGFGDRRLIGRGDWDPTVDWSPATPVGSVPLGRHADCTAATDPEGAVRLVWRTHVEHAWRVARVRWDGAVLAATASGVGIVPGTGDQPPTTSADGLPSDQVRAVAVDADGSTWFATAAGAAVRRPDGSISVLTVANTGGGLGSDDVRAVAVAPDGTVWFGHPSTPLTPGASARRPDNTWLPDSALAGLLGKDVRHVATEFGGVAPSVWFATATGVVRRTGAGWSTYETAQGLLSNDVRQVVVDPHGALWVATAAGPARISRDGSVSGIDLARLGIVGANDVRAIAPVPVPVEPQPAVREYGPVWMATAVGLVELRSDRLAELYTVADGLPGNDCRTVLVTPDGVIHAGTSAGLGVRDKAGWHTLTTADGLIGDDVRDLHGPWSAPQWFADAGAGEQDPQLVRDGNRLWLASSHLVAVADPSGRRKIRIRRFDWPGPAWTDPTDLTNGSAADREPAVAPRGANGARVYFRSDRGGGADLFSADIDTAGAVTAPAPVLGGPAADTDPTSVGMPDGSTWLLFRSDRNIAFGRLGGDVAGSGTSRHAADEASVRRFAGSVTVTPNDLDRNRGRRQFGDLLSYTPQRPDGTPPGPDELYTPNTLGLYVERGPAGRPLVARDAERLRQLLIRFLPVNRRAIVVLRSAQLDEEVFGPGQPLGDSYRDEYPFAEYLTVVDASSVSAPGWRVFRFADPASRTSVPSTPTTPSAQPNRSWWPPFPEEDP